MPTYLEGIGGMEYQTVLTISFVRQFVMKLLIPFAGSLSDRIGRKPVWRISLIGLIAVQFMKDTVGASLRGNEIPETGPQEIVRIRAGKA